MCSGICIKYLPFYHGNRTSQPHKQRSSYHSRPAAGSQALQTGHLAQSAHRCREGWAGTWAPLPTTLTTSAQTQAWQLYSLFVPSSLVRPQALPLSSLPFPIPEKHSLPKPWTQGAFLQNASASPRDTPEAGLQVQSRPFEWEWRQHSPRAQTLPGPLDLQVHSPVLKLMHSALTNRTSDDNSPRRVPHNHVQKHAP